MFNLYEIGRDWDEQGVLISKHQTKELAEKRMNKEAKKRVKTVYYIRANMINDNITIYDYGLWNKFLVIRFEDADSIVIKKRGD